MIATNEFRKGAKVEIDNVPYEIVSYEHVSPGKGRAFTRTKLKNLLNNNVIERTITSGDKLPLANLFEAEMQFLYQDASGYNFMNQSTYDQVAIDGEIVSDAKNYLIENLACSVMYYNDRPIGVSLPNFVELKVSQTDPAFKGDTVTGGTKPATLETGFVVNVPFHIKEGDVLKIDTRENRYVERVNK